MTFTCTLCNKKKECGITQDHELNPFAGILCKDCLSKEWY